jgi:hypothetical protein
MRKEKINFFNTHPQAPSPSEHSAPLTCELFLNVAEARARETKRKRISWRLAWIQRSMYRWLAKIKSRCVTHGGGNNKPNRSDIGTSAVGREALESAGNAPPTIARNSFVIHGDCRRGIK